MSIFDVWGGIGMLLPIVVAIITYIIYYFIIRRIVK